jgi:hypothetical protein
MRGHKYRSESTIVRRMRNGSGERFRVRVPCRRYTREIHTYEIHTYEIHTYEIQAYEIHAYEIHAYEKYAYESHAHEMQATTPKV